LTRRVYRFGVLWLTTLLFTLAASGISLFLPEAAPAQTSSGALTIEPLTWDFIGLDSNNPKDEGPNSYLIGARVCNVGGVGGANIEDLSIRFVKEGANNPYITVTATGDFARTDTITVDRLSSGATPPSGNGITPTNHHLVSSKPNNCFDAYYNAEIKRDEAAFNTVQKYRIEATASGTTVRTPSNRQLYVEKLVSQGRNDVSSFTNLTNGSNTVYVGGTYTFRLVTTTSSGYPQLTVSSTFPNAVFQFENISSSYTGPTATNSSIYADACGWLADYTTPGYHTSSSNCDGPVPDQYPDGKVGNTITTDYTVKILSTGTGGSTTNLTVNHLILDFSGGSFHYNADTNSEPFTITVYDPQADLSLTKSHVGNFTTGVNTYQLAVTNAGPDTAFAPITVTDTLPTGYSYNSVDGTSSAGWSCSSADQTVTCSNPNNLANGATSNLNLRVNVAATAATNAINRATVSSSTTDPNASNNSAIDPTTVVQGANLKLTKTHAASSFVAGKTEPYTLKVENTSSTHTATGPIYLNDTLPAGLTYVSATGTNWTCTANGQNISCQNPNSLAAGQSSTLTLSVTVDNDVPTPSVTNTASVSSSGFDANTADNTAQDVTPTARAVPDLTITKSHTGDFIQNGVNLYTITVTNQSTAGSITTGEITVIDDLPKTSSSGTAQMSYIYNSLKGAGWSCTSGCGSSGSNSSGPVTFSYDGALSPGESSSFTIQVIPTVTATSSSPLKNKVTVKTTGETNTSNNTAEDSTTVNAAPNGANSKVDLYTQKTVSYNSSTRAVTYTITAKNNTQGSSGTDTGNLTDTIPSDISFSSTNVTCTPNNDGAGSGSNSCGTKSVSGQTITYSNMTLKKNGGSATITVTGTLTSGYSGYVSNTVTLTKTSSSLTEINPGDNQSTAIFSTSAADLIISKIPSASSFAVNENASYTLKVTNQGTGSTFETITVTDTLPSSGVSYVSAKSAPGSSGWTCSFSSPNVTCTNSNVLAANASSEILLTVTPTASGSLVNNVSVSTPGESNTSNNTAQATTPVTSANSDLVVTKSGPTTVGLGEVMAYPFTVKNQGTTTAQASSTAPMTITDTLQTGVSFLSGGGAGWSCSASGQTVTCTNPNSLAPSASSTLTLYTLVGAATASPILNQATVSLTGESVTNNNTSNQVSTAINASADLSLTKTAVGSFVNQQNASYDLVVSNNGPSRISSGQTITITDTLPSNLSFVATGSGNSNFSCSAVGQAVTCTSNSGLAAGSSETVPLKVKITAATPSPIQNTAAVSSVVADPNNSNNNDDDSVAVTAYAADLELQKSHTGSFVIGQTGTYTLTVTNHGGAVATAPITITDPLPDHLSYGSFFGTGWSCSADANDQVTCTHNSDLASGDSSSVDITVAVGNNTPTGTNSITNRATVTSTTPEPSTQTYANIAADPTTVIQGTDLAIAKTNSGSFKVNATDTAYVLTITNGSNVTAEANASSPITVIDYLPLGVQFNSVAVGTSGFSCSSDAAASGNTITCRRTSAIPAGYSDTITLNVKLLANATFPLENIATVGGLITPESNLTNNTASNTVSSVPDLLLVKRLTAINPGQANAQSFAATFENHSSTPDDHPYWPSNYLAGKISHENAQPGDELEYTIYFLSGGSKAISNVNICDVIPEHTTYVANSMRLKFGSNASETSLTDASDSDAGQLHSNGATAPCVSVQSATRSVAVVNLAGSSASLPAATAVGTPAQAYGYVRLRATVD
jgi:uncharacterized repeat protein (TIGR01451 family)